MARYQKDEGEKTIMNNEIEQNGLITEVIDHMAAIQQRFQAEGEDEEKKWMMMHTSDSDVIDFLKVATVQMLHVIDAIGELEPVNGITISKQYNIPRGSVSKITRRLADIYMIQFEPVPDNKKEVLFRLTPLGKKIFILHQQLHQHIHHNMSRFLHQYKIEDIRFLVSLMKDVISTSWVQIEEKAIQINEPARILSSKVEISSESAEKNDIVAMLQQLDAKKLSRAKQLIQLAFFED